MSNELSFEDGASQAPANAEPAPGGRQPPGVRPRVEVGFTGDVDQASEPEVYEAVARAIALHRSSFVFVADVGDVSFMDSSGLRAFIIARLLLNAVGASLELRLRGNTRIARLLSIAGLSDVFDLTP